jgi:hypothetical protein
MTAPAVRLPARVPAPRTVPATRKPAAARPRLVLVSSRRQAAGRLPFLIVIGAVLVSGLVGVLFLHMLAAQDAYRATALQDRLATLNDQAQQLTNLVEADSSPHALQQRAARLGMVPTAISNFHRLHDGRAVGVQKPVLPPPPPAPTPTHSAAPKHTATAKHGAAAKHGAKAAKPVAGHGKQQSAGRHHSSTKP